MKTTEPGRQTFWCNLAGACAAVVALLLIFAPGWYAPSNEQHLKALLTLSGLVIFYFDSRKGLLSGRFSDLHARIRREGSTAFSCLQPLPLLGLGLSVIATVVTGLRG